MVDINGKDSRRKGSTHRVPVSLISAVVPPLLKPMGLVPRMFFEAALQLWPDATCKFIDLAMCFCQLGSCMRDGNEGVLESLERG